MGFLGRRKGSGSQSSVLSEEEIQQKLYGEFKKDTVRVVGGSERDSISEASPVAPRAATPEPAVDLFSEPKAPPVRQPHPDFPMPGRTSESAGETVSRPAVYRPAETKYQAYTPAASTDPYQRYRELNRPASKPVGPLQSFLSVLKNTIAFLTGLFESNRFFSRQILYWTGGVLAVFLLFWSVNALNMQREEAMKTKYQPASMASETEQRAESGSPANDYQERGVTEGQSPKTAAPSPAPIKKEAASTAVQPPAAAKPAPAMRHVIQVATYPSRDYAARVVSSLTQAGFKAFVKENVRSTGTVFYVVMIGTFSTAAEAQQQLSKFRANEIARPFPDAFVRRTEI